MKFLPDDYQAPKSSGYYMKLQEGENKIRILSQPVLGWEDWVEQKPIRHRMDKKPQKSHDPSKPIKHFWAFVVWNYLEEKIQILHITQTTIRNKLESLCKDSDWGDPYFYDIKIIKEGKGKDTDYTVNPLPHKDLNPVVIKKFEETPCYLPALFENENPFAEGMPNRTPGIFQKSTGNENEFINDDQKRCLEKIFAECDPTYFTQVMKQLKQSQAKIDGLEKLPLGLYERIKNAAEKKKQEYFRSQMGIGEMMEIGA